MKQNVGLKDTILQLTAMAGELSGKALERLESTEAYRYKCMYRLRQEQMLEADDSDGLEGFRLLPRGKHYLVRTFPDRFAVYFADGNGAARVRRDALHRRRYLRASEVLVMLNRMGVSLYPDQKPKLYGPLAVVSQPCFYTSGEVKSLGEETVKIQNARFLGLLRGSGGEFLLYHTGSQPIKWEEMSERRAVTFLERRLKTGISSVMIGDFMDTAVLLLEEENERKPYYHAAEGEGRMHYIPIGNEGEFLLRMLTEGILPKLEQPLLRKLAVEPVPFTLRCDGLMNGTDALLLAFDFDLPKIRAYRTGTGLRKLGRVVYCFDFQAEALNRILDGNADLRVIDSRKTGELFGISKGGGGR